MIYLGQPVYSLTVVIFSFLIASALGSMLSQSFLFAHLKKYTSVVVAAIIATAVAYTQLAGLMTYATLDYAVTVKLILIALMIFPLGFLMECRSPAFCA